MTKKEAFIEIVKKEIFEKEDIYVKNYPDIWDDAKTYFLAIQESKDNGKAAFTPNGKIILKFLQDNKDLYNNLFKAKDIGEQLGISSRTVSGGMRKLVTDGYVEKMGENPVIYSITSAGIEVEIIQTEE